LKLNQGVREELTTEEFLDSFEDSGDREYLGLGRALLSAKK